MNNKERKEERRVDKREKELKHGVEANVVATKAEYQKIESNLGVPPANGTFTQKHFDFLSFAILSSC